MNNNGKKENNQEVNFETFSEVEIDEIREKAIKEAKEKKHEWRQRGVWLVCVSCENKHAFYIGIRKRLIGVKDGKPILKDREDL